MLNSISYITPDFVQSGQERKQHEQTISEKFANDEGLTVERHLLHLAVLIVITVAYTLILTRTLPKNQ